MKSLRGALVQLEWLHPAILKREHELRSGDDRYGTLVWEQTFGSLAVAETADQTWTFKRTGFVTTEVTVRVRGSEANVASLRPGWLGKGTLIVGNQLFDWSNTGFWTSTWGFSRPDGTAVVQFQPKFTLLRRATDVVVEPSAWAMPELPLLVCLGWYMMVSIADASASTMIMMGD